MNSIDLVLRSAGMAFGLLLLLVVAVRGGWRGRAEVLVMLCCTAAYLVCSAPSRGCSTSFNFFPFVLAAIAFPFAFWRLARVVLEDDRTVPALAWAGLATLVLSGLPAALDYLDLPATWRMGLGGVNKLVTFVFLLAALARAWLSWAGDLVEPRRRLRWMLVAYLGIYSFVISMGEVYLQGDRAPPWLELLNVALIALTLLGTAVFLLGLRPDALAALFDATPVPDRRGVMVPPATSTHEVQDALAIRLEALMTQKRLYRDPDLSVKSLSTALDQPEYLLRRLINERLGYRNFPSYINAYRLREVAARLLEPSLDRRPILTLALEAGFGSIGPFNRAFRDAHGMTPSEFRSRRVAPAAADAGENRV